MFLFSFEKKSKKNKKNKKKATKEKEQKEEEKRRRKAIVNSFSYIQNGSIMQFGVKCW